MPLHLEVVKGILFWEFSTTITSLNNKIMSKPSINYKQYLLNFANKGCKLHLLHALEISGFKVTYKSL